MAWEKFSLESNDGLTLQYFLKKEGTGEKGVICLVHGMGEHAERYEHVADFFNQRGYFLLAFDQRGHGTSEGKRGHTPDYETLMNDLETLLLKAAQLFPSKRIFLYGHSMGGNLVLNYGIRRSSKINGIVASAPYLKLAFEPPSWKVSLAKLVVGLMPALTQATGLKTEHLSRDKKVVQDYDADKLNHDQMSTAFFMNVHFAGLYAIEHAKDSKIPALLVHGTGDKITSHKGSEEFKANAPENVSLKLFDGLYHEVHNEPEKESVLTYIADWLDKQA